MSHLTPSSIRTCSFPAYGFPIHFFMGFHIVCLAFWYSFSYNVCPIFCNRQYAVAPTFSWWDYSSICLGSIRRNIMYSNAPSLLPVLAFRLSSLLWASPTPSGHWETPQPVRVSHVHALPFWSRNHILPRVPLAVQPVVYPSKIAGFVNTESLADTNCVTRLNCGSSRQHIGWT